MKLLISAKQIAGNILRLFALLTMFTTLLNAHASLKPLPPSEQDDSTKTKLGAMLFSDPMLSSDGTVSCATCHPLDKGGADGRPVAVGVGGRKGSLNTPSIFNCSLNMTQGWISSDKHVRQRARKAVENFVEMDRNIDDLVAYVKSVPDYAKLFQKGYGTIDDKTVFDALEIYVDTLRTPAPFDRYLLGDLEAIGAKAKRGYRLFRNKGCVACHNGANIGGQMFQKFGIFDEASLQRSSHPGRYALTKKEIDRYVFKVPSLRNVAKTPPYFHDGSVATLKEAIRTMARHQIGEELQPQEVDAIEAFLESLSGELLHEH